VKPNPHGQASVSVSRPLIHKYSSLAKLWNVSLRKAHWPIMEQQPVWPWPFGRCKFYFRCWERNKCLEHSNGVILQLTILLTF
jgi:hypothetical protein